MKIDPEEIKDYALLWLFVLSAAAAITVVGLFAVVLIVSIKELLWV